MRKHFSPPPSSFPRKKYISSSRIGPAPSLLLKAIPFLALVYILRSLSVCQRRGQGSSSKFHFLRSLSLTHRPIPLFLRWSVFFPIFLPHSKTTLHLRNSGLFYNVPPSKASLGVVALPFIVIRRNESPSGYSTYLLYFSLFSVRVLLLFRFFTPKASQDSCRVALSFCRFSLVR